MTIHDVIFSAAAVEAPARVEARASEVDRVVDLLRDIPIWADPANESELRKVTLPCEIRTVRLCDSSDGTEIGRIERTNDRPYTAFKIADILSWHIDYRDRLWASTKVKSLDNDVLELSVNLTVIKC